MIIYCNGDSFVAGTELGDTIIPGHPGFSHYRYRDTDGIKWLESSYDENTDSGKYRRKYWNHIDNLGKELSFSTKIGSILNLPTVNNALPGASMERIVRTTINDLITLKRTHTDIVAVIGTTFYTREDYPTHDESIYDDINPDKFWISINGPDDQSQDELLASVIKYKLLFETPYHARVRYYQNLILLRDFCKLNDIRLLWVATCNDAVKEQDDGEWYKKYPALPDINNFREYLDFKYTLRMFDVADEIRDETMCPGFHFSEIVHDEVAKRLAKIIQESTNV